MTAGLIRKPLFMALRAEDIQDSSSPSVSGIGLQAQTWKMNCRGRGVPCGSGATPSVDPAAQCSFLRCVLELGVEVGPSAFWLFSICLF